MSIKTNNKNFILSLISLLLVLQITRLINTELEFHENKICFKFRGNII